MLSTAFRLGLRPLCHAPCYGIGNWKLPAFEMDSAGISGFFESRSSTYLTLSEKLQEIRPGSLYYGLDEWTREMMVTMSMDMGIGFATTIILTTIAIKTIFLYPTMRGQLQSLRQGELKQLTETYK